MSLRWKRIEAGHYRSTNDLWEVRLDANNRDWRLFDCRGTERLLCRKKQVCQAKAEALEEHDLFKPEDTVVVPRPVKTPPRRPGKRLFDPDLNLEHQRKLASTILHDRVNEGDLTGRVETLARLVIALDNWIARGGRLPKRWSHD